MRASVTLEALILLPLLVVAVMAAVYYASLAYASYAQPPRVTGSEWVGGSLRITLDAAAEPTWAAIITRRAAYIAGVNATLQCTGGVCVLQAPVPPGEIRDAVLAATGPWGLYEVRLGDLKGCLDIRAPAGFHAVIVDPGNWSIAYAAIDDDYDGDVLVCGLPAGYYYLYVATHGDTVFARAVVPPGGVGVPLVAATPSLPAPGPYTAPVNEAINVTVPALIPTAVSITSPCTVSSTSTSTSSYSWQLYVWIPTTYYGGLAGGVLNATLDGRPAFLVGEAYSTSYAPLNITYYSGDCIVYSYRAYSTTLTLHVLCLRPGTLTLRVACTTGYSSTVWEASVGEVLGALTPVPTAATEAANATVAEAAGPGWLVAWYRGTARIEYGDTGVGAPACSGGVCAAGLLVDSGALRVDGGVARYYPLYTLGELWVTPATELNATVLAGSVYPASSPDGSLVLPLRYYWALTGPGEVPTPGVYASAYTGGSGTQVTVTS